MWYQWKPYVPVAKRRAEAAKKMAALRKKGVEIEPVVIEGRKIARTFWGEAWCEHLESLRDYAYRLERGRSYVRNGSVCHLAVAKGKVEAKVSGSELYNIKIQIETLADQKWSALRKRCAGQIGTLLELLQGRLSEGVMSVVTNRTEGLFPLPGEITFQCDCPDWAGMCKHIAAVLYGVGSRLDQKPELLFLLRGVDHEELIASDAEAAVDAAVTAGSGTRLQADDLSEVFGIDLAAGEPEAPEVKPSRGSSGKTPTKRNGSSTSRRKTTGTARPSTRSKNQESAKATASKPNANGKKTTGESAAAKKTAAKSRSPKKKRARNV